MIPPTTIDSDLAAHIADVDYWDAIEKAEYVEPPSDYDPDDETDDHDPPSCSPSHWA